MLLAGAVPACGSDEGMTHDGDTGDDGGQDADPEAAGEAGDEGTADAVEEEEIEPAPCADGEARFAELVALMERELAAAGVPGGAIAVICGGQLAFSAGIGMRCAGGSDPAGPDTRFQIASTTKMFTAAAAMALHDDGLINLGAPLSDYVPYANTSQPFGITITLHDLLTHSAGYPSYFTTGIVD